MPDKEDMGISLIFCVFFVKMVLGERALWRTLLMTTIMKHLGDKVSCNRKDNHKLAILLAQYAEGLNGLRAL